jgi:hypothetical protein
MPKMNKVRKNLTLPSDIIEWAEKALDDGKYAGVRSLSGLVEYLLRKEMKKNENRRIPPRDH